MLHEGKSGRVCLTRTDPFQRPFRNGVGADALGPPTFSIAASISLGEAGTITVRFTDNVLTGSGNANADLYVFETGSRVEPYTVEVSKDCTVFTPVGTVGITSQTGAVDLDRFGFGPNDLLFCVRITDIVDRTRATRRSTGPT